MSQHGGPTARVIFFPTFNHRCHRSVMTHHSCVFGRSYINSRIITGLNFPFFQVLLRIFSYLTHREILDYTLVCKKWHMISQDPKLWAFCSLRPEISGLHVDKVDTLIKLINTKFASLRYLEILTDLVTPHVSVI